ncbi:MAG: hypothetical protein IPG17_27760 [Sandaracinaceae bacterium]|nr:hypothetical protein [Sandaracinaceae bacterium]
MLVDPGEPPTLDAREIDDPHSPKFDALAREILGQQGCGHLVFIDNVAAHVWIKMVLVEAGIPEARIAILNAEAAPGGDDRLRIANEFNGQPLMVNGSPVADLSQAGPDDVITEPAPPKYDVLIANAVAYEGIDLQTRTCQIHHIDLPYEPATLQQRNGRAVRQGNRVAELPIKYYLARKGLDGFRFNLIGGKLGWMNDLIAGTARATNNPGAQETGSLDDMLIELSRNPSLTAELQRAQREQRLEEARRKAAKAAAATLRAAAARFETARKAQDAVRAASLRAEGERLLRRSTTSIPSPGPGWAGPARPASGRCWCRRAVGLLSTRASASPSPDPEDPAQTKHLEFGRAGWDGIGQRRTGSVVWVLRNAEEITQLKLQPQAADAAAASWPNEDAALNTSMAERVRMLFAGPDAWTSLGWQHAPAAFVEQMWARYGTKILARMEDSP